MLSELDLNSAVLLTELSSHLKFIVKMLNSISFQLKRTASQLFSPPQSSLRPPVRWDPNINPGAQIPQLPGESPTFLRLYVLYEWLATSPRDVQRLFPKVSWDRLQLPCDLCEDKNDFKCEHE